MYNSHRSIASRFLSLLRSLGNDPTRNDRSFVPTEQSFGCVRIYLLSLCPEEVERGEGPTNAHKLAKFGEQTPPRNDPFFLVFFFSFFFFSLDDRPAIRANALPQSVAFASSILCGYVSYTFTLERRFVLPHSALLDGQRKNELRDRREAGSYRLSSAPRDSIRMVAALLPARQHH